MRKVADLIKKHNKNYSSFYQDELYTHTPMALEALSSFGATSERIEQYYHHDVQKLELLNETLFQIKERNFKKRFGCVKAEASYVAFFIDKIQNNGLENTLKEFFDCLMEGVGAAAFHPLIRLSFALERGDEEDIAISMGSWAASFLDLGVSSEVDGEKGLLEILSELQCFHQNQKVEANNIANRMKEVSLVDEFREAAVKVKYSELEDSKLEERLLWFFAQSNNFTLLHGVTAHHAFERLIHLSSDKKAARIYFWKAVLAAYLSTSGVVKIDLAWVFPVIDVPSWDSLTERAVLSNDNHVLKLVYILKQKEREELDFQRRYAAALKLGMVS